MKSGLLIIICTLSLSTTIVNCAVSLSDFFPYGSGDSVVGLCTGGCFGTVNNIPPFPFALSKYTSVHVGTDGYISFNSGSVGSHQTCTSSPAGKPMITPFWVHIDTTSGGGRIYYRQYSQDPDGKIFTKAAKEIAAAYPGYRTIKINWVLVATWVNVSPYPYSSASKCGPPKNTFQAVLATDGTVSFAIFYYNSISWITGATGCGLGGSNCGMPNPGGTPAKFGFDQADGQAFEGVKDLSCTTQMVNIEDKSNVNEAGKFIYKIDGAISVDRCDSSAFQADKELLQISPSYVSAMGHQTIHIQGPCYNESWVYFCTFKDRAIGREVSTLGTVTEILDTPTITCNVPYLYTDGLIDFNLLGFDVSKRLGQNETAEEYSLKMANVTYRGMLTVVLGSASLTSTLLHKNSTLFEYELTWSKDAIYDTASKKPYTLVDIQLVIYSLTLNEWKTQHVVSGVNNNGKYTVILHVDSLNLVLLGGMSSFKVTPAFELLLGKKDRIDSMLKCANDICKVEDPIGLLQHLLNSGEPFGQCSFNTSSQHLSLAQSVEEVKKICDFIGLGSTTLDLLPLLGEQASGQFCVDWLAHDFGFSLGTPPQCAPLQSQAQSDPGIVAIDQSRYSELWPEAVSFYRSSAVNANGVYQRTNFGRDGRVIVGPSGGTAEVTPGGKKIGNSCFSGLAGGGMAGDIWGHVKENILPRSYCCRWSNKDYCNPYFNRRPISDCSNYRPPQTGNAKGDPHIRTLDGLSYTFNGAGEFWMIKPTNDSDSDLKFYMQARMEPLTPPTPAKATVFTAFVMKNGDDGTTVQIELSQSQTVVVRVCGVLVDFSSPVLFQQRFDGVVITVIKSDLSEVVISFDIGLSFLFSTALNSISVTASVEWELIGKINISGLLGTLNWDSLDDLTTPNGTVIDSNSDLTTIHYHFGILWLIGKYESLFFYESGKTYDSYYNQNFIPKLTDPSVSNSQALAICGDSYECLFDYESTGGNIAFANQTMQLELTYNKTVEVLEYVPPMCPPLLYPENGLIELATNASFAGSHVSFGCLDGYTLKGSSEIVCQSNTLTWSDSVPRCVEQCNSTIYQMGQRLLQISPSYISAMGHQPIHVQGPCFNDSWSYFCTFHDRAFNRNVSTQGKVTPILGIPTIVCNVPYLYTEGRIEFSLTERSRESSNFNGNNSIEIYRGVITVVIGSPTVTAKLLRHDSAKFEFALTWQVQAVYNATSFVDIQLVVYNLVKKEWQTVHVYPNIPNSGRQVVVVEVAWLQWHFVGGMVSFKVTAALQLILGEIKDVHAALACANDICTFERPVNFLQVLRDCPYLNRSDEHQICDFVGTALSTLDLLPIMNETASGKMCTDWLSRDFGFTLGTPPQCPPLLSQAQSDANFIAMVDESRYKELFPDAMYYYRSTAVNSNGVYQRSNYGSDGRVIVGPSGGTAEVTPGGKSTGKSCFIGQQWGIAGEIWGHVKENILPRAYCCRWGNKDYCNPYFNRRPISDCSNYRPPQTGNGRGDPHIRTLDGLSYTFNGAGEFWMIKPFNSSLTFYMQARMEPMASPTPATASVFTAFVMKNGDNGTTVQVELSRTQTVIIRVCGVVVDLSSSALFQQRFDGVVITVIKSDLSEILISFDIGLSFSFSITVNSISVIAVAEWSLVGKLHIAGLLGTLNRHPLDDLTIPNGTIIDPTSDLSTIHYHFGLLWLVAKLESLFIYEAGKHYDSYVDITFIPKLTDPQVSDPDAIALCGDSYQCLFDYESTGGNIAFANQTKELEIFFNQTVTDLEVVPAMCSPISYPDNGVIEYATDASFADSQVLFVCLYGYRLNGSSQIFCNSSTLTWSNSIPVCERIVCPPIPALENGVVHNTGDNYLDGLAIFSCNTDYFLEGSQSAICQANSEWNATAPVCKLMSCTEIHPPVNGQFTNPNATFYVNDTINISCDDYLTVMGAENLRCQSGAQWSAPVPTCERLACPPVAAPDNGHIPQGKPSASMGGDWVSFTCNDGYLLTGSCAILCEANARWSDKPPQCQLIVCDSITSIENGVVHQQGFGYGSQLAFKCYNDFELQGSAVISCQADGKWNATKPHCKPISCPEIVPPSNGEIVDHLTTTVVNGSLSVLCSDYYTMIGDGTLHCKSGGHWSGSVPVCEKRACPSIKIPSNGYVSDGHPSQSFGGEVVTYECHDGYTLKGPCTLICEVNGVWSNSVPSCIYDSSKSPAASTSDYQSDAFIISVVVGACCAAILLMAVIFLSCWVCKLQHDQSHNNRQSNRKRRQNGDTSHNHPEI